MVLSFSKLATTMRSGAKNSASNDVASLTVCSTEAKFTLSGALTKLLGVKVGESVIFVNTFDMVYNGIADNDPEFVEWVNEQGLEWGTKEAEDALIKEYGAFYIGKGFYEYDAKGLPIPAAVKMTEAEKTAYKDAYKNDIVAANREALIAKYGELSDEELAEVLTIDDFKVTTHSMRGSKTATTSKGTGIGLPCYISDTSIWNRIKGDRPADERTKFNRVYDVDTQDPQHLDIENGNRNEDVTFYKLVFREDKAPVVRAKAGSDSDDSEDEE